MKQALASYQDFAGSPVDVLELESDHFPGAKTKTGVQPAENPESPRTTMRTSGHAERICATMPLS